MVYILYGDDIEAFDASSGRLTSTISVPTGQLVLTSMTISNGMLYVGAYHDVYAFGLPVEPSPGRAPFRA